jgi:hypothetical protein
MSSPDEVLDRVDAVLRDCTVGPDAMRWVPDHPVEDDGVLDHCESARGDGVYSDGIWSATGVFQPVMERVRAALGGLSSGWGFPILDDHNETCGCDSEGNAYRSGLIGWSGADDLPETARSVEYPFAWASIHHERGGIPPFAIPDEVHLWVSGEEDRCEASHQDGHLAVRLNAGFGRLLAGLEQAGSAFRRAFLNDTVTSSYGWSGGVRARAEYARRRRARQRRSR